MCGIAGWVSPSEAALHSGTLGRMLDSIKHRGPDDRGEYSDSCRGVALGHVRLSIIDLSVASHQPMIDAGSGVTLTYNGELYNFRLLRSELESFGHRFISNGDTEVVLRSFLQWGSECFPRFAGMFAVAIWDPRSGILHLARDPLGMKPLYYAQIADGTVFASEVKAFKSVPGFTLQPSALGLHQYLEFGYVFDVDQTIFDGIRKLPPGSRAEVRRDGTIRIDRYFVPPTPVDDDRRAEDQRVDELRAVMTEVTEQHLIADVPVGLLLSGGLDSSVIAALASRMSSVRTITMGFSESDVDERPHARQVAAYVGSNHTEVTVTPRHVMDEVVNGAWVFDDLFADWGTITTRLMYRRCREEGVKVVLVGEGADELFGGYDVFSAPSDMGLWRQFRLYQRYAGRRHGRLFARFRRVIADYLDTVDGEAFAAVRMFESCRQLPNQYVMKVDKASMAESIEARAPYLDRRVAELAWRTPREWLMRAGENKYLLRALARHERLLPPLISHRPKFGAPLAATWMDDHAQFRAFARERVVEGAWADRLGIRPAMIEYFQGARTGYAWPRALSIFRNTAWRLLLLELWAPHYVQEQAA